MVSAFGDVRAGPEWQGPLEAAQEERVRVHVAKTPFRSAVAQSEAPKCGWRMMSLSCGCIRCGASWGRQYPQPLRHRQRHQAKASRRL